jgi:thiamine biosynthesis lipoprotein
MGTACEILIDSHDADLAARIGEIAEREAQRIEGKYSRYKPESLLSQINASGGRPIILDDETAALIDYAAQCFELSGGLFDVTSGVLRRLWRFDGSAPVPTRNQVNELLPLIGWSKVIWRRPELILPPRMEIDLGGIGKEYGVDRAMLQIEAETSVPTLVNFGGDLRVSGPRASGRRWRVAIDAVDETRVCEALLEISRGALTTSGDAMRSLVKNGRRYSHILDPRTGWPVKDPPRSVTVAAPTCMEAGLLSTLAMLHGARAERFLEREGVRAWWTR